MSFKKRSLRASLREYHWQLSMWLSKWLFTRQRRFQVLWRLYCFHFQLSDCLCRETFIFSFLVWTMQEHGMRSWLRSRKWWPMLLQSWFQTASKFERLRSNLLGKIFICLALVKGLHVAAFRWETVVASIAVLKFRTVPLAHAMQTTFWLRTAKLA